MILYCATSNPGKLKEFRAASTSEWQIEPLPGLASIDPPDETGTTFEQNAQAKAIYYSGFHSGLVFAEDSGLAVDALGGEPGVYSARYAGASAGDQANNALVLEKLRGKKNRKARFICVIALAQAGEMRGIYHAEVEGRITEQPEGGGGFGYDPIFFYEPFGCTFAQVSRERKQTVSHRGEALRVLLRSFDLNPIG